MSAAPVADRNGLAALLSGGALGTWQPPEMDGVSNNDSSGLLRFVRALADILCHAARHGNCRRVVFVNRSRESDDLSTFFEQEGTETTEKEHVKSATSRRDASDAIHRRVLRPRGRTHEGIDLKWESYQPDAALNGHARLVSATGARNEQ
jgi:hypothetical protein